MWSKALLSGEKINENQKDPGFAPRPGQKEKKKKVPSTCTLTFSVNANMKV